MQMPKAKSDYFSEKFPDLCPTDPKSEFQYFGGMGNVPEGWFHCLVNMCEDIQELNAPVQLSQVKQKFGDLRVHFNTEQEDPSALRSIVRRVEIECSNLCAVCGADVPEARRARVHGIGRVCSNECLRKYTEKG